MTTSLQDAPRGRHASPPGTVGGLNRNRFPSRLSGT
jgi:hypothetical protein